MASKSLGTLRIDLVALTSKFEAGIKGSISVLTKFGLSFTRLGKLTASVGKSIVGSFSAIGARMLSIKNIITGAVIAIAGARIVGAFHDAAVQVDELGKKAKTVGLTVEQMSVLRLTASETGVEFETLSKLAGKAQKNIYEFVSTGGGPAAGALKRLRLQLKDSEGNIRNIADLLPEIARAFDGLQQGEKLSLAEDLFGRAGGESFVQLLEDSGDLMKALGEETDRARRLGVLFSESQFQAMKNYNDATSRIREAWLGIRVSIMSELAPTLTAVANTTAELMGRAASFIRNFLSVVRAAINKEDIVSGLNEKGNNRAWGAIKELIRTLFVLVQVEVTTRIKYLAARVWETLKIIMSDVFGKIGESLGSAVGKVAGFLGEAIDTVLVALGNGFTWLAEKAKEAGDAWSDAWTTAGENLRGLNADLENQRDIARESFGNAVRFIDELGEKYRKARGEAEHGMESFRSSGTQAERSVSKWNEFVDGMKEQWKTLSDQADDFRELGRNVLSEFTTSFSGGLARALASGEASFKNFGKTALSVIADVGQGVAQMFLQFLFFRALVQGLGFAGLGAGGATISAGNGGVPQVGNMQQFYEPNAFAAKGGVFGFANGGIASGVLGGPRAFSFDRKIGVAGEAGPEVGFAPLRRINGELGVKAVGGGTVVQVIDQRRSGAAPTVDRSTSGGRDVVRVLIRDEVSTMFGEGRLDSTMKRSFGIQRKGVKR